MQNRKGPAGDILRATLKTMPWPLKIKIAIRFLLAGGNREKRLAVMREIGERRRFTIPRAQIPWHPTIDEQQCTGCKICIDFCPKQVFVLEQDAGKAKVLHAAECVFLCNGCEPKCPCGAITFPNKNGFIKYVYYE